ncbi:unnamed protein product, partial [Nesidiocoris tenuis]
MEGFVQFQTKQVERKPPNSTGLSPWFGAYSFGISCLAVAYNFLLHQQGDALTLRPVALSNMRASQASTMLLDVVYREETLLNVIRSVTRNGRSIILTAVLALILVYMFSIIGYMFFKDDFLVHVDAELSINASEKYFFNAKNQSLNQFQITQIQPILLFGEGNASKNRSMVQSRLRSSVCKWKPPRMAAFMQVRSAKVYKERRSCRVRSTALMDDMSQGFDGDIKERACDSLLMCIVTTLNQGLRNGGGIGDILRAPSSHSKWKYCDRPKIENRNRASEKTFSYTHLLRITSRTSVCVSA